jgi:AAA domain-containing protein
MIQRARRLAELRAALKRARVTALIGPRQASKTTLARAIVSADSPAYFDLEDPRALARLAEPMTALAPLRGLVMIDEIQRRADIFPILRVLADRRPLPARFLILGSATPDLLQQSSETLAGRLVPGATSAIRWTGASRWCLWPTWLLTPASSRRPREGADHDGHLVQQNIDMESYRIQQTGSGRTALERRTGVLDPVSTKNETGTRPEELEALSRIIAELNELFGLNLGPEHRLTLGQMMERLDADPGLDEMEGHGGSVRLAPDSAREYIRTRFSPGG